MKYIKKKYSLYRGRLLAQNYCQRFFKVAALPELKVCKTLGFIASILL